MPRSEPPSVAEAVRVLAAPGSVLALVVLALNDHVLKEAWPGSVTGKLSDVAGLVFAPLLLAVVLAALRVRQPVLVATVVVGLGFVATKSSAAGAEAVSDLWSLSGVPTMIRADVTDLVALPALGLAWWIDRDARRRPELPWRKVVTLAVGTALVPCGVLATAATSPCIADQGVTSVARVQGDFPGPPREVEQRLVLGLDHDDRYAIDASRDVTSPDVSLSEPGERVALQCDPADPSSCWRIRSDGVEVERSSDGGRRWQPDLELSDDEVDALEEETGESCGEEPDVTPRDIGVLPAEDGDPVVLVPVGPAGAYLRGADGEWQLMTSGDLADLAHVSPPPAPEVVPQDQGEPEPPTDSPGDSPRDTSSPVPTQSCPSPTPTTVTPHASNGPPTTYDVCP